MTEISFKWNNKNPGELSNMEISNIPNKEFKKVMFIIMCNKLQIRKDEYNKFNKEFFLKAQRWRIKKKYQNKSKVN